MALSVLIVDDNSLFLDAARGLLEREGMRVVGVASTSAEALRHAEKLRPEVVLVDIMLGAESGFELARRLVESDGGGAAAGFLAKSELSADGIHRIVNGRGSGGDADVQAP